MMDTDNAMHAKFTGHTEPSMPSTYGALFDVGMELRGVHLLLHSGTLKVISGSIFVIPSDFDCVILILQMEQDQTPRFS